MTRLRVRTVTLASTKSGGQLIYYSGDVRPGG
jgi:hypothetical protein